MATKRNKRGDDEMSAEEREALRMIAYDPTEQHLDLSKSEKLRTTALMLAIQYVEKTIVSDVQMFQALKADGRNLIPATTPFVLQSAVQFEQFLLGSYSGAPQSPAAQPTPATEEAKS